MQVESFADFLEAYGEIHAPGMVYREGEDFGAWPGRFRGLVAGLRGAVPERVAAEVEVVKVQEIGGGYITVLVTGDVGSVQSAVTAGGEAAERVGEVITRHVIARPSEQILSLYLTQ